MHLPIWNRSILCQTSLLLDKYCLTDNPVRTKDFKSFDQIDIKLKIYTVKKNNENRNQRKELKPSQDN